MSDETSGPLTGRRRLLAGIGTGFLLGSFGLTATATSSGRTDATEIEPARSRDGLDWRAALLAGDRSILMRRDGPAMRIRYRNADGSLDRDGYVAACHMLRDVRANRIVQIDPELLDVLCGVQRWMEFNGKLPTIEITSGFRTVSTNESAEGSGRQSMHLYGKAADIIVPGASSSVIGAMVRRFNDDGGTGIYPSRQFVHVDTGAPRSWIAAPATRPRRRRRR
ncbi:YcbK family protein [Piscinibacter sakaiensis]|uniref:YcbK family protein n=1 Tax=Piscinibacter sakaiensis TaxID=1547922 RepID=UPI003AAAB830